jgi:hypothetical protein
MSNEEVTVGSGVGATRRTARQGVGGSPVGSTLSIVLAVVAVIAGFLILRNITSEDSSSAGGSTDPVVTDVQPTTTFDSGVTTTVAVVAPTTLPLVTEGATVVVANANTVGGSAGRMSEALGEAGYNMGSPVNATVTLEDSIVYYDPTNTAAQGVAESVARSLGGVAVDVVPTPPQVDNGSLDGAGVLLMLGNNEADKTLESLAEQAALDTTPGLGTSPPVAGADVVAPTEPAADE